MDLPLGEIVKILLALLLYAYVGVYLARPKASSLSDPS